MCQIQIAHVTCKCRAVPFPAPRVRDLLPTVCVGVPVTRAGDAWCSADPDARSCNLY